MEKLSNQKTVAVARLIPKLVKYQDKSKNDCKSPICDVIAKYILVSHKREYKKTINDNNKEKDKIEVSIFLQEYINGTLAKGVQQSSSFYTNLGEKCGLLSKALNGFDDKTYHFDFIWDIKNAKSTFDSKKQLRLSVCYVSIVVAYIDNYNFAHCIDISKMKRSSNCGNTTMICFVNIYYQILANYVNLLFMVI